MRSDTAITTIRTRRSTCAPTAASSSRGSRAGTITSPISMRRCALSARYYRDTWGIRAITLGRRVGAAVWPWTLTPAFRYYTQGAADFYRGPPFPVGFVSGRPYSADQRFSAFGAITAGIQGRARPGRRLAHRFQGRVLRAAKRLATPRLRGQQRQSRPQADEGDVLPGGLAKDF